MTIFIYWGAPGTGKTHVLKDKLRRHGPANALLTTFSRSTADRIRYDCARDMDTDPDKLKGVINTIHGTCYRLLGGPSYAKVVDAKQIKEFNNETGYDFKVSNNTPEPDNGSGVCDAYTWLCNTETPIECVDDFPAFRKIGMAPSEIREQIKHYVEWKENHALIDFSDMLTEVLKLELIPDVDLMLVDEFQDLTSLQFKIFRVWSAHVDNVIVAGDPLQSIYGFMGGSPDYFQELSGDIETIPHSYRLSKPVWDFAVDVATDAGMETPDIETATHKGKIKQISYRDYTNDIEGWEGTQTHTVYHLVRSRYQAPAICKAMAENGIIWKGLNGWTDSNITTLNTINRVRNGGALFRAHLSTLAIMYPVELFNFAGSDIELLEHIANLENTELPNEHGGLITHALYAALQSADPTGKMENAHPASRQKINNALKTHTSHIQQSDINTSVLTIHASKGLDADRVYLHTGISTNTKKAMRSDPAAEARVFYVGISRAKKELMIVKDKGQNYHLPVVVT